MGKKASFLLIDDNGIARKELAEMLRYLGYARIWEGNGAIDGWSLLHLHRVECIISAWDMADMSGFALLKILRNDPHMREVPFFLTRHEFSKVDIINAGKAGVTGLLLKPFDVDTLREKITAMIETKPEETIVKAESSINRGLKLIKSGSYDEALRVFEAMVRDTESAEIYYNIGYIKTSQGKYDEALIAFRKATQLDRLFAKAYLAMGRVYRILGNFQEAEQNLEKAAEIYIGKDEVENAEVILQEILEINPATINVYNSLGVISRKKGDYPEALKYYHRALKIHPNEPNIHYNIGRLYVDLGNPDKAKAYFEAAVELDPHFSDAREIIKAITLGKL